MTDTRETDLSIVIAAWNNTSYLRACLASLEDQITTDTTEVIVMSNFDTATEKMEQEFSFVQFVRLSEKSTVPELRADGVLRSKGKVIALLEDHCTFDENWCTEIMKGHELSYAIVGGAVENGLNQKPLDWAVYFYDYGKYMLPENEHIVTTLSGANVSYKREVLEGVTSVFRDGFYENTVHDKLQKQGHALYLAPSAIVYHNKNYFLHGALTQSYHHARAYAAKRILDAFPLKRAMFVIISLALPFLLPSRIVVGVIRKSRHFKELIKSLPYLLLLLTGWSYGEFIGYLFGGGKSPGEWR